MSWLNLFWNSSIEGVSRDGRYVYIYLLGKANALGVVDYRRSLFLLDTGCDLAEFEAGLQELIQAKLVHSTGDSLIVTRYIWNRRKNPQIIEEALNIYDDLPTYRKTELQMIPLPGLEYVLNPEMSKINREEKKLGFDPTKYRSPLPEPNPMWDEH